MPKRKSTSAEEASKKVETSRENSPSMIGCTAANFHEASRSEYLAHYVFSSFGTSVPVPRQEDTGLDLICTLTERVGQRLWPIATYSVQVKSTADPWVFNGERSVRWIVEHPMPIFLCVVDKKTARVSIYNTWPRFLAWVTSQNKEYLAMVPGVAGKGESMPMQITAEGKFEIERERSDGVYSLSAPIAEFSVTEVIDSEFHAKVRDILHTWIECDIDNIHRIRAGIKQLRLISDYKTNNPCVLGQAFLSIPNSSDFENDPKFTHFIEHLKWVAKSLGRQGELKGFLRAALLLRHLDVLHPIRTELGCHHLLYQLEHDFSPEHKTDSSEQPYAGLDGLDAEIDNLTSPSIRNSQQRLESYERIGSWIIHDPQLGGSL